LKVLELQLLNWMVSHPKGLDNRLSTCHLAMAHHIVFFHLQHLSHTTMGYTQVLAMFSSTSADLSTDQGGVTPIDSIVTAASRHLDLYAKAQLHPGILTCMLRHSCIQASWPVCWGRGGVTAHSSVYFRKCACSQWSMVEIQCNSQSPEISVVTVKRWKSWSKFWPMVAAV